MTHVTSQYPVVSVAGSIRLGQFLKLAGLVEDGAQARIAIQSGDVTVNGAIETRRGHHLADGDVVVVDHPADQVAPPSSSWGPGNEPGPQYQEQSNGLAVPALDRILSVSHPRRRRRG